MGNSSTAPFVARGFSAHFTGGGAVGLDHMPNAGFEEIADRIITRPRDHHAIVVFLQINGLHITDGDYEGEPERLRAAMFEFVGRLSAHQCQHKMYIDLGSPPGIPYQRGTNRHIFEVLLDMCVEVFVELGFLSSRAKAFADQCTLTGGRSV